MTAEEHIAELEATIAPLREQIAQQGAYIRDLEARLAKDCRTSSKPPSSDGLKRTTKRLRHKSGKQPGGQLGPRGETLHLVAMSTAVVEHRPASCPPCHTPLAEGAGVLRERRQGQDRPPVVRLGVREHRARLVRCPYCAHVSSGAFPAEVKSRAQYRSRIRALAVYLVEQQHLPLGRVQQLLVDRLGLWLARGTLVRWVRAGRHRGSRRWSGRSRRRSCRRRCCSTTRRGCAVQECAPGRT
jgi:transposase